MASKAQRSGMTALIARPTGAMAARGRIAPENSTAGKHSSGSASVACAGFVTAAEVKQAERERGDGVEQQRDRE